VGRAWPGRMPRVRALRVTLAVAVAVALAALLAALPGCRRAAHKPAPPRRDAAAPPPARRPGPPRVLWQGDSRFGKVIVVEVGGLRILRFGKASAEDQSAFDPRRPRHEPLEYVRLALLGFAFIKKPTRVLMVGLGGGSFLRHARRWAPRAVFEAVEINPVVVRVCRKWFGFEGAGKVAVHVADGRRFIEQRLAEGARYDLVFLDAYDAVDYPRHLGTREFFVAVRRLLSPGGVAVANLSPNTRTMRDALVRTFADVLPPTVCLYSPAAGNTVVVGGPGVGRVQPAALSARLQVLERHLGRGHDLQTLATQQCPFSVDQAPLLADPAPEPRARPPKTPPKKK
jgi:spermidine synthase